MRSLLTFLLCLAGFSLSEAQAQSIAGLWQTEASGRTVYNFNQGWRYHLGDAPGADKASFNDSSWEVVCAPHTAMLIPSDGSGGRNYQGVCWYRKHFTVPQSLTGHVTVHFEAIMGKQTFWVNGREVRYHEGGYLPVTLDLTALGLKAGDEAVIAVRADNSDDKTYPPGKKQSALDFCYHGGMYRDVWLIGTSPIHITDAVEAGKVAGGGVFLHYDNISEKSADVFCDVDVENTSSVKASITVQARIKDKDGKVVKVIRKPLTLAPGSSAVASLKTTLQNPVLWTPETPYLYNVEINLLQGKNSLDGGMVRMGIRKAEFRGQDGFWLNGKPYHQLIGGNRHQDFAYVGNALPNNQQWRDALRLRNAGMHIIRAAHYPQDPAFMDACDELGLFIIVPTPGWQYWNKDPEFAKKVHQNTREIIRRDRNHPSVLMWEPILNETRYPEDFAVEAHQITIDEFPWPGRPVAAADMHSAGVDENYEVLYGWTTDIGKPETPADKCIFTREFGEMVDDWYAQNNINRANRAWGERPQLMQALSLANTYGEMHHCQRQFIGGCQWHPFDHQRGYHPDPYMGGIYDAFRQKKLAWWMFRSQAAEFEPMVKIANEMTQFSPEDVVVFSNCDSVRLTVFEGDKSLTLPVEQDVNDQPHKAAVFKNFWDFWQAREYSYKQRNWQKVVLLAEGIKDGKVVCSEKKMPSRRSTKLRLYVDEMGKDLVADGSDFIVVVAEVTDDNGNVRRFAKDQLHFTVEGEGRIIGDASIAANPRLVEWGSAPVLIQATNTPGDIRITVRSEYPGAYAPTPDTLVIRSVAAPLPTCHRDVPSATVSGSTSTGKPAAATLSDEERRRTIEEVEKQQQDFGVQ